MFSTSLLGLTVRELADKAGVHRNTVSRAETDQTEHGHVVAQIVRTLEVAGVEFMNGDLPGVRLKAKCAAGGMAVEDLNASNDG